MHYGSGIMPSFHGHHVSDHVHLFTYSVVSSVIEIKLVRNDNHVLWNKQIYKFVSYTVQLTSKFTTSVIFSRVIFNFLRDTSQISRATHVSYEIG